MKIRAITIGQKIPFLTDDRILENSMKEKFEKFFIFNRELIENFDNLGIEVQTKRLCSQPILSYEQQLYQRNLNETLGRLHDQLTILERLLKSYDIDYLASCALLADHQIAKYGVYEKLFLNEVPQFIKRKEKFFTSLHVASTENGINLSAIRSAAKIIKNLSDPDPFNNLKFCLSSNVKPDTPFFPAAYHISEKPSFGLALEMADEVVNVFDNSKTLGQAQTDLRKKFNEIYENLVPLCEEIGNKYQINFHGIDFSPAPYPTKDKSIGSAFEKLNFEYFGAYGSLIAIALINTAIPKREKVIGFSGFMPSVLEDYTIANSLTNNKIDLNTLLLYATICGTGLDCVPLPGNITEKELFYILLDLCVISIKLDKPLTARLMPIPGKEQGDSVDFDFEYFSSSKIMDIRRLEDINENDIFSRKEKSFDFLK
ncbi:MAG: DUF711 family protein [Candidatus Heimdallarchaeota archaeon]